MLRVQALQELLGTRSFGTLLLSVAIDFDCGPRMVLDGRPLDAERKPGERGT